MNYHPLKTHSRDCRLGQGKECTWTRCTHHCTDRKARKNSEYVRQLLREKQPEFAAALTYAEQYLNVKRPTKG